MWRTFSVSHFWQKWNSIPILLIYKTRWKFARWSFLIRYVTNYWVLEKKKHICHIYVISLNKALSGKIKINTIQMKNYSLLGSLRLYSYPTAVTALNVIQKTRTYSTIQYNCMHYQSIKLRNNYQILSVHYKTPSLCLMQCSPVYRAYRKLSLKQ